MSKSSNQRHTKFALNAQILTTKTIRVPVPEIHNRFPLLTLKPSVIECFRVIEAGDRPGFPWTRPETFTDSLKTVQNILALVSKEGDLFLEVKRATVPMSQDDKQNLSVALSGFANSAGCVLVFGLIAQKNNADEPDIISREEPIAGLDRFLPEVQSLIGKAVVPLVDGVAVKAVKYERDPALGLAVVLIPESDRGPHSQTYRKYFSTQKLGVSHEGNHS